MTTNKKPAKKAVAKKAPAKKAAVKKAPAKKASAKKTATTDLEPKTDIIKPNTPSNSGAVVYAAEIKNPSLRDRVFNWFRNASK